MMDSPGMPFRSAEVRPEILPPRAPDPNPSYDRDYQQRPGGAVSGVGPSPGPVARPRRKWAYAPATYILLAINCAVFLPMALHPGINTRVILFGANSGAEELGAGQWWRPFTAMFIHDGYIHFLSNMWCLWNLGMLGEPLLGTYGLLATYVLTGLAGSLLSSVVHPDILSLGASGAVFGLAGVLIMLLKSPLLPVPTEELKRLRRSVIWFAALNFVIGGGVWLARTRLQIDNMAHLGGFLSGLALGFPLVPRIGARRAQFVQRQRFAFGAGVFGLLLLAFGIYSFNRN